MRLLTRLARPPLPGDHHGPAGPAGGAAPAACVRASPSTRYLYSALNVGLAESLRTPNYMYGTCNQRTVY